ncbi:pentatricopeptide repeat-containing protein [Corchorus olitorius]|uniref:Pentatricopeptide repeat-containing protein n=1 Tax=Corchorus olitorius TaxID=93759 RepID=A0A1R3K164_9ROSI|nr:pentatricopeptide repeat-containing protein [Corchorus olitorius]
MAGGDDLKFRWRRRRRRVYTYNGTDYFYQLDYNGCNREMKTEGAALLAHCRADIQTSLEFESSCL